MWESQLKNAVSSEIIIDLNRLASLTYHVLLPALSSVTSPSSFLSFASRVLSIMDDKALDQSTQSTCIKPQARLLHDPAVTFEEYQYYVWRTREEEKHLESPHLRWRQIIHSQTNEEAP